MLRLFPLFLGSYFQINELQENRKKKKDYIDVYGGRYSILEGSVSSAKSGEICSSQRIKSQCAVIPPVWTGMAERNAPVFTEH